MSTEGLPYVIKRDGRKEKVTLDKITARIYKLAIQGGLDVKNLKLIDVIKTVIDGVCEGIHTRDLDTIAAKTCAYKSADHYDYGVLAARIEASNLQKETKGTFSETVHDLYFYYNHLGQHKPIVRKEFYDDVMANRDALDAAIVHERDYDWTYFGLKTVQGAYLLKCGEKVVERPQYMLMRVAVALHQRDLPSILETYECMSQRHYIHASPTLFNAGTHRAGYASCFLASPAGDSIEDMYELVKECAAISKHSGGIGIQIHDIRAKGSNIHSSNGTSEGIIPYLRVLNNTMRHVTQSARRPGSMAVYLEPTHPEILEFIELRNPNGSEEVRARDLWLALWIPDLFMQKVLNDDEWCLFCPDEAPGLSDVFGKEYDELYHRYEREGRYRKKIRAREIMDAAIHAQIATGAPYMSSKDAVNRKANQKHIGTIKSSNLCVAPETLVLTKTGYKRISELEGQHVPVWNGSEFSDTTVIKTNDDAELITLTFSNGTTLDCTPYHKFHIRSTDGEILVKQACELMENDVLVPLQCPVILSGTPLPNAYQAGKAAVMDPFVSRTSAVEGVPVDADLTSKIEWLRGYIDRDPYCVCPSDPHGGGIVQILSCDTAFLNDVRYMLQTMGINPVVNATLPTQLRVTEFWKSRNLHKLHLSHEDIAHLRRYGFSTIKQIPSPNDQSQVVASNDHVVTFVKCENHGRRDATYCFNEPKKHLGVFNGILAGNCNEINIISTPDEIGVCILASIGLPSFVKRDANGPTFDHNELRRVVHLVTRNLNKVIDRTDYPVEKARRSNERHRPIGIGVSGVADMFCMMRMPFESKEAAQLNREVFETIYFAACEASCELAKQHGPYESYQGSEFSKGKLQFDLWEPEGVHLSGRWDWDALKDKIAEHGMYNSLLTAIMPTATTSQILGYSECIEPYSSNIYLRKVLSGEFQVVNSHLLRDLCSMGIWNDRIRKQMIMNNGSIQNIKGIPDDIKALYKTTWEIKQRVLIDLSADRGPFIDQTQSLNLFKESPTYQDVLSAHVYGWKKGLKTMMYYLKMVPGAEPIKVTLQNMNEEDDAEEAGNEGNSDVPMVCRLDDPSCLSCSG